MKRTVTLILTAVIVLIAACFTSCVSMSDSYANSDKYSAGNAEFSGGSVHSLDINWSSGKVIVSRHDADTVTITESSKTDLKNSQKVHTWLDGDILRIQYCKSGETFVGFTDIEKELEIKLPAEMELTALSYDGSSGDAVFEEISAKSFKADSSSGDVKLIACTADEFDIESSSGDITVGQAGEAALLSAEASSGDIEISAEKVGELEAETSSGDIGISVKGARTVDAEASSGSIALHLAEMPEAANIDTSSGSVKVYVPEGAGFTADIDTSSGDFDSGIALSKEGGKYISGSGSARLSIETSSGNIRIIAE